MTDISKGKFGIKYRGWEKRDCKSIFEKIYRTKFTTFHSVSIIKIISKGFREEYKFQYFII